MHSQIQFCEKYRALKVLHFGLESHILQRKCFACIELQLIQVLQQVLIALRNPDWSSHRSGGCRYRRRKKNPVRHLGRHGQHRLKNGEQR